MTEARRARQLGSRYESSENLHFCTLDDDKKEKDDGTDDLATWSTVADTTPDHLTTEPVGSEAGVLDLVLGK